jgi:hypothetical protein
MSIFSAAATGGDRQSDRRLQRAHLHPICAQDYRGQGLRDHCQTGWVSLFQLVVQHLFRCYADFAKVGGAQQVSLADECIDYATIIHEFMHVIGFIHGIFNLDSCKHIFLSEHQREDRSNYVSIIWKNVIPGRLSIHARGNV